MQSRAVEGGWLVRFAHGDDIVGGMVEFARARGEKSMAERLANEILDASKQQGNAWKRKDDIYRMAQANKAFAHYRW